MGDLNLAQVQSRSFGRNSQLVAIRKLKIATTKFSDWKRAIFRCGKEIKGLCGGVVLYAAQASPQIDAATAEKGRFRMKTGYIFAKLKKDDYALLRVEGCGH